MESSPLAAETRALMDAYAALNRNDIDGFVQDFDPQIERVEPDDFPSGGTYRGIAAVREHVAKGRGTWAEGTCTPERAIVAGDKVILVVRIHVRLKDRTDWIEGQIADVFAFRDGKAILFRTFGELQQALDWVGAQ